MILHLTMKHPVNTDAAVTQTTFLSNKGEKLAVSSVNSAEKVAGE